MSQPLVLDAGPVGRLIHPARNKPINLWLQRILETGFTVILPEIADYEVRRNLILERLTESIRRLDELKSFLVYQRITTQIMMRAAELWADSRRHGRPTADEKALDGDVILAATTQMHDGIIITDNVGHLGRYVEAHLWSEFTPPAAPRSPS
jgi:predicted nucleic acid-binding protein